MKNSMENNRFRIGKIFISATNQSDAITRIEKAVTDKLNTYICVSNIRMVRYANKRYNTSYRTLMNESFMNLPDGTPLTWCAHLWGLKQVKCTSGPQLFMKMMNKNENGIRHFLLGDTEETLQKIKEKYGTEKIKSNIVDTFSPPFVDVEEFDYEGIAAVINESNADIVWVSMRSPKQDIFSRKISPLLKNKICISVGRAFRISIGEVKDAPNRAQKLGIAGIFTRRVSLPAALLWYFGSAFHLMYYLTQICCRRIIGKKHYE